MSEAVSTSDETPIVSAWRVLEEK